MHRSVLALSALLALSTPALAAPLHLSHQGRLLDAVGDAVQGSHTVTFKLYDVATGGTAFWTEPHAVVLEDGYFAVILGESTPLDVDDLDDHAEVWLGLTVDTGTEMTGRVRVVSVPYAVRAEQADTVAPGVHLDASDLVVDGTTVISTDGTIDFGRLTNVPPDALAALTCSAGQIPRYGGSAWACAPADDHVHGAEDLTTGVLAFGRLPVGTTSTTVAAGDHTHGGLLPTTGGTLTGNLAGTTATFSGAVSTGALSASTASFSGQVTASSVQAGSATLTGALQAGSVSAGTGAFSGAVSVGSLSGASATFTGAVGAQSVTASSADFGSLEANSATITGAVAAGSVAAGSGTFTGTVDAGTVDASTVSTDSLVADSASVSGTLTAGELALLGALRLGDASATCDAQLRGALRFGDVGLQVCDGGGWQTLYAQTQGKSASDPGQTCLTIKTAYPSATDGPYWLKPAGYGGAPFQTWCDMTTLGGGWTMVGKVAASKYDQDGGQLDGADTARWIGRSYLGDMTDLESETALGPAYESVAFRDFMFVGLHDTTSKLAWRHATTFTSLFTVFSSGTQRRADSLLLGDFRSLDYRPGCTVGQGPNPVGPQYYGFNINSDGYTTGGTLVSGYTGGWCASLAGYGRDGTSSTWSGGGLGAICQGRSQQMARHYWDHGDGCTGVDWNSGTLTNSNLQTFFGHAFFVR